jgi:predicted phosphodiesterase
MEVVDFTISHRRPDIINIYPIGDIHAGSIACAENEIRKQIEKIKNDPLGYIIGMGDYADCIIKEDKRFQNNGLAKWVESDNIVNSQRKFVSGLFEPVKDKIICLLTGNHEESIHDKYQDNFTLELCRKLGVRYAGYQCFINVQTVRAETSQHGYRIHAWHGDGAAQTEGARMMRLVRLVNDIEADIYLMGHFHAVTKHTPDRLVCRNGKVKAERLIAVMTGAWLKGYTQSPDLEHPLSPSYIEKKGYKPSRIGCPVIHICPDKDWFTEES